jgi:hypothetical protein
MDSLINAAGRALAIGDPLASLKLVALREDPPALALRGIAMAQLGDLGRAKTLLLRAARAFGSHQAAARARCLVAEAEVALAARDLRWNARTLEAACATLEAHGDSVNAAHARTIEVRRLLLLGRLDEAEQKLAALDPAPLPPALTASHELAVAALAVRRVRTKDARAALASAEQAARAAGIPALLAEVGAAVRALAAPAARLIAHGKERSRPLPLADVEAMLASPALVVDACRYVVRQRGKAIPLARRPVLFTLVRTLAEAWPGDASRETLVARSFGLRLRDDTHRARLRVEMGRDRKVLSSLADVSATPGGFRLAPRRAADVVVLARPVEDQYGAVLALLADGESWSTSALGLALGTSQRTVQRSLDALARAGKVQTVGRGRARRWMTPPVTGFATTLLLSAPLLVD